jgi:glycosyltransferase involved in cell wall biosynthesis
VDGTDVQAVKGAIVRLRDDPELARRMGERGRAIVESGLNWKAAAERLVGVYESLEGNGAR